MKKAFRLIIFALALLPSLARSQDLDALSGLADYDFGRSPEPATRADAARINSAGVLFGTKEFVMSRFDGDAIRKFNEAWNSTGNGTTSRERVVLILKMIDGRYGSKLLSLTNDYKSCTFTWHPATIAIIHTHPNSSNPKPQQADIEIADRYKVLMFTITSRGMYLYDPSTRQTTKVQDDLEWLKPSSWEKLKAHLNSD